MADATEEDEEEDDVADDVDDEEVADEAEAEDGFAIDLDGLDRRIVAADNIPAGTYFRLEATDDGFPLPESAWAGIQ